MANTFYSRVGLCALVFGLLPTLASAQSTAHYVPGTEGIKGATLPPPGFYLRDYNLAYTSSRLNDNKGDEIPGSDFSSFVYAQVPRLVWISDKQILGGFLGVDGLWPMVYQDVSVNTPGGPFDQDRFSLGDPFVEATLSWHLKQFDFSVGVGEWFPAGAHDAPPTTKAGLGYWGTMFTAGLTWYPDAEKTWAISLLNRYEINGENTDTDITPGDAWTLEWGVSKAVSKTIDLGVVGYYQEQITKDDGAGASNTRDRVAAIGPEISIAIPEKSTFLSLRYLYEFMAEDRAQGHTITFTLTYRF